jgi:hypothetical protein
MVPVERPKTNEKFASREKILKWKTGFIEYGKLQPPNFQPTFDINLIIPKLMQITHNHT